MSFTLDRSAKKHLGMLSKEGGVEIEQVAVENPDALMAKVRHAGSIFLGRHTPEALGDYVAGPNHVLPTSRSARPPLTG